MLSALILKARDPMALAATLSCLVAGAVEGVVREVVVVGEIGEDVRRVADHAGCRVESAEGLLDAAPRIKGDWVLILEAGETLAADWVDLALRHAGVQGGEASAGRFRSPSRPGFWRSWTAGRRGPLLLPKAHLVEHLRAGRELGQAARGIRVRPLRGGRR